MQPALIDPPALAPERSGTPGRPRAARTLAFLFTAETD